jgi:hypothetical protein
LNGEGTNRRASVRTICSAPQWSPPSIGGSTYLAMQAGRALGKPQWSPLPNSGRTNAIFTALDALWEPQWSPLVVCGTPRGVMANAVLRMRLPQWSRC